MGKCQSANPYCPSTKARTSRNMPVTGIKLVPAVSVVPGNIGNNTNGKVTIISGIR